MSDEEDTEVVLTPSPPPPSKQRRKRSAEPIPTAPVVIPDRLYFSIGEVSEMTGVPAYVLRYWESQFKIVAPEKNAAGQRMYRRREVEMVLQIRRLLYAEQYTIAGARRRLRESLKETEEKIRHATAHSERKQALLRVSVHLRAIAARLSKPVAE